MLKNYFKTTFRYFRNHKGFSLINIIGLTTGICVCFFALLYVQFELSRDSYNIKADDIYRLVTDIKTPAGITYESAPAPMGPAIEAAFPEVKSAARVFMDDMIIRSNPDNAAKEEIAYADASVFSVFTWPLLHGNPQHLFDAPFNVVLTASAAKKYFGNADPIGQTLLVNSQQKATVTGIMQDIPHNSHLQVSMLFSMSTLVNENWNHNWTHFGFYTYLLLSHKQDASRLQAKLPAFVKANFDESTAKYTLTLEPLKRVYLYGKPRGHRTGASASGSITNVYVIGATAILVLFIACFNFINLTTAFSLQRAKEIGVRKVLGASKNQLVIQFFTDAALLCLVAFVLALMFAVFLLPLFNQLTGTIVSSNIFENFQNIVMLFSIAVVVGLLSGAYPALFLSGFKPISSLKGKYDTSGKGLLLRKSLVIAQFTISIFLIVATVVVYKQLNFMQNQQLGFQKDHKLVIDFQFDERILTHTDAIKHELQSIPGVGAVSLSSSIPGTPNNQFNTVIENNRNENQAIRSDGYFVDEDFLRQYQVPVVAGRNFTKASIADEKSMLINETMVKRLGFKTPQQAIGKRFTQFNKTGNIIGVVKDFHFHSFLETVQPLTIRSNPGYLTDITVNISSANIGSTIKEIEKKWKNLAPGLPLVYFFADEAYNQQYIAQQRFGGIFTCFAAIAIVISCLGLLGLSAFNTAQRKKEIGIRKVLGASSAGIAAMLSRDFVKLIVTALLLASPLSWLVMNRWLQSFAYRINIPLWIFLFSGSAAILIALVTISFQSIKAALVNPVKSLRSN